MDDVCPCGSEAACATGDPLVDHATTCSVYQLAVAQQALQNMAQWGDAASMESLRDYARATLARLTGFIDEKED